MEQALLQETDSFKTFKIWRLEKDDIPGQRIAGFWPENLTISWDKLL